MKISWSIITFWKLTPSRNTPQIRAEDRITPRMVTAVRFVQPQVLQGIRRQDVHARTASSRTMRPSPKEMMRSACRAMSRSWVTMISVWW